MMGDTKRVNEFWLVMKISNDFVLHTDHWRWICLFQSNQLPGQARKNSNHHCSQRELFISCWCHRTLLLFGKWINYFPKNKPKRKLRKLHCDKVAFSSWCVRLPFSVYKLHKCSDFQHASLKLRSPDLRQWLCILRFC